MKKSFSKFQDSTISMANVYGGANPTEGTGDCSGTGCSNSKHEGRIIDWDDVECGDTMVGKNSGKCDPAV